VAVAYGLSFAALIFASPLTPWIAYGIAATFATTTISAAIVAVRGSLPFAIAGPDGATAAVTATMVAHFLGQLDAEGAPDDLLAPVMIVMALSAALAGILLFGLGLARAGGAIRFVPYPVVGGFLGATGWLMVNGAARVVADKGLSISTIGTFLEPSVMAKLAATAAIALALYFGLRRRGDSPYVLPGILLAGIGAAYLAFTLSGMTLSEARGEGWMFKAPAAGGLTWTWDLNDLGIFPWRALSGHVGDLLAVMFVTAITMLLNTTGIEFVTRREADLQRDLKTLGVANLAGAALGGYVSCISLSRTTLNYAAGGRGRLSGLVVAIVSGFVLTANPGFLAYVPKFVLGGLLLYLGFNLIQEWFIVELRLPARLPTSAIRTKQTSFSTLNMSAFGGKADMSDRLADVR
jgi:sulfate permease, SulP family